MFYLFVHFILNHKNAGAIVHQSPPGSVAILTVATTIDDSHFYVLRIIYDLEIFPNVQSTIAVLIDTEAFLSLTSFY